MSTEEPPHFKSLAEIEAVKRQYNKNCFFFAWLGAGTVFGVITIDLVFVLLLDKTPITTWLDAPNNKLYLVVAMLVLLPFAERTDFFRRTVAETGRLNLIIRRYEKGQAKIESGIRRGNERLVIKGVSIIEGVEASFSTLQEFNDLLLKAREWLKMKKGQNA